MLFKSENNKKSIVSFKIYIYFIHVLRTPEMDETACVNITLCFFKFYYYLDLF